MARHMITFLPHDRKIEVDDGEILIRAAMETGVHINASCGGEGVCGKCRVIIEQGQVDDGLSERLSPEDIAKGYRLACLAKVRSDLVVRVPVESDVDSAVLNLQASPRHTARIRTFDLNQLKEQGLFIPPVEKKYLELPEPTAQDNIADVSRLLHHLKIEHNEHRLVMDLNVMRTLPDLLRQGNFKVTATIVRPVREDGKNKIVQIESGDTTDQNLAVAMDIGTTTIYGEVLDLNSGEVLSNYGDFNAQISYGEDVISRIVFSEKTNGLATLQTKVIETVNKVLGQIIKKAGIGRDEITTITLAGNSTMTQLLLGITPQYLRRAPYVPASNFYPPFAAADVGIDLAAHAIALVYPGVASYVGGDIVAGVMGSGMYRSDKLTLFMDIGTNAEIVIGNKDWMVCTAASAGPAFEGGGVTFGMRAARGAIEDFSIDLMTLEPMIMTIGNVRPKGICGSGLITIVARLFEAGVIDNRGKFNQALGLDRIRQREGVWEYVLVWQDATQIDRDISITEPDIDNLIRAKGAMYSAAQTLLEEVGLTIGDIEEVILAGGFGSYIDLEKAMTIGLLPEVDPNHVTYLGNSSLLGAKMSSFTNRLRRDVGEVVRMMTNFELAETPSYMDHYMGALFIPHTDLGAFPRLAARLELLKGVNR
ncbi:Fdx8 [Desulforapulum autotrophicum HRM2]|uniref:Fdx8 n=1 Tax=Desulforapulum autotrophicum (strain ATCC 43914 / DSM 3382 / VKM B-1955 / HRM2) TaxID=177437 RepID=C0QKR6_DESAH|nr:ASKHA domain-containing protein [Desulforapulum autotrophicum]ACN16156.1 Fdx8 [Desulforapulum autotrophicum HRM2]